MDLDGDVLFAANNEDLYGRVVASCRSVVLHHSPHGILEQLEENVIEV